jgi:coenzyme F420-reducing hydrogenase delta subunit
MSDTTAQPANNRVLKTYLFFCSNHPKKDLFEKSCGGRAGDIVKPISLPCSGKVDIPYLLKAFETGADGVAILTCNRSECRSLEGALRARKRAEAVASLLEEIGLEPARIAVFEAEGDAPEDVLNEIKTFFDQVRNLPEPGARRGGLVKQESTAA